MLEIKKWINTMVWIWMNFVFPVLRRHRNRNMIAAWTLMEMSMEKANNEIQVQFRRNIKYSGLFPKQVLLTIDYLKCLHQSLGSLSAGVLMIIWKVKVVIKRGWITEEHRHSRSSPNEPRWVLLLTVYYCGFNNLSLHVAIVAQIVTIHSTVVSW